MPSKTIQRVEINKFYDSPIHCPFCGSCVVHFGDGSEEPRLHACPHTLFIAHDTSFEYRSERFDKHLSISGVHNDDIDLGDAGIDAFTDRVGLADAVKFALYVGPPSGYGTYIGFAPV